MHKSVLSYRAAGMEDLNRTLVSVPLVSRGTTLSIMKQYYAQYHEAGTLWLVGGLEFYQD